MLKIGVPSKGRLMEMTFDYFAARGIAMRQMGAAREYAGAIEGLPGAALVLISAAEMPGALARGQVHLGVTGSDLLRDTLADWPLQVAELTKLGFGQADLVLAVPRAWVDVETLDDLDAVAARFRAAEGRRLRIATKYHRLVRGFLSEAGVADYQLVGSLGATEGAVAQGAAEAIADITSSGQTLRDNHLKILADGLIHRSEAVLYAARAAAWGRGEKATLTALAAALGLALPTDF